MQSAVVNRTIFLAVSPMSIIGAGYMVASYFRWPEVRTAGLDLVIGMAIADFFFAAKFFITGIYGLVDPEAVGINDAGAAIDQDDVTAGCVLLGIAGQVFAAASVAYNGCVALNVALTLRDPFRYKAKKAVPYFHLWSWGFAFVSAAAVLMAGGQYGPSGDASCWIMGETRQDKVLQMSLFFVPLNIYYVFCVAVLVWLLVSTRCGGERGGVQMTKTKAGAMRRMLRFLCVFLASWFFQALLRVMQATEVDERTLASVVPLSSFFNCAIGGMNALAWVKIVRSRRAAHRKKKRRLPTIMGRKPLLRSAQAGDGAHTASVSSTRPSLSPRGGNNSSSSSGSEDAELGADSDDESRPPSTSTASRTSLPMTTTVGRGSGGGAGAGGYARLAD